MILIVDDQKDIGTGLERLLRYAGHEAVSVTGGAEALAMLHGAGKRVGAGLVAVAAFSSQRL
jgi:CheY-like chemotaxis protein